MDQIVELRERLDELRAKCADVIGVKNDLRLARLDLDDAERMIARGDDRLASAPIRSAASRMQLIEQACKDRA